MLMLLLHLGVTLLLGGGVAAADSSDYTSGDAPELRQ